ncbi:MAG: PD-(D/E)XK motif protein [Clostridia bacterium]|nr:PD-(D/E)XK motif protein [Clostridia bacterium]
MRINEIASKLDSLISECSQYSVFFDELDNCYFGKDKDNNIVYMLESSSPKIPSVYQETKSLRFVFNQNCSFSCNDVLQKKTMHILTCKESNFDNMTAFIRLTKSFSASDKGIDQYYLAKLFSSVSSLFDKKRNVTESEIQGLFSELYTIRFFYNKGCDLAKNWQSKNKMKFDFSIDSKKRLEIKSTLKPVRIHHFRHEQLQSELYDIKIVSIMLQKNDYGLSLGDLVNEITELFPDDFSLLLHIEKTISQIDNNIMHSLKYDETYIKNNIKVFDAKKIPHFNEKNPDGVFNAEYDCDLETTQDLSIDETIKWICDN